MADDDAADKNAAKASTDVTAKIEVPASEVLAESGTSNQPDDLRRLTPTQQAGMWLAIAVGSVIVAVITIVVIVWFKSAPNPPALNAGKDVLDNYKTLNAEALTRVTTLFDLLATKALLPIFTAVLGYIFGTRNAGKGNG